MNTELFLELLQVALGTRDELSRIPSREEWDAMFREARRQCVLGVCLQALCKEDGKWAERMGMDADLKLRWIGRGEKTAEESRKRNRQCLRLCEKLAESGYWCCILKGQGLAQLYPYPQWRQSGDIDVWVRGKRGDLVEMTRRVTERRTEVTYHHTDFPVFEDTPVELHFHPSWMCNPLWNCRLQRWFDCHVQLREDAILPVPSTEFNVVFVLVHILRHVLDEGVGMRQIIDYYYVLHEAQGSCHPPLRRFGLERFAAGLMWMMHESLGLPREWMVAEPDRRVGEWLLREVMLAGNFGHDDPRVQSVNRNGRWHRLWWRMRQSTSRMRFFPVESVCEVPWRTVHLLWRKWKGYCVAEKRRSDEVMKRRSDGVGIKLTEAQIEKLVGW